MVASEVVGNTTNWLAVFMERISREGGDVVVGWRPTGG